VSVEGARVWRRAGHTDDLAATARAAAAKSAARRRRRGLTEAHRRPCFLVF